MRRLNTASVMERLDISSRETLRQLVKRGVLPEPMRDEGGGCNYWMEDDITQYLQSQAAKRSARHDAGQPAQAAA